MYIALKKKTNKLYGWLIGVCDSRYFDVLMALLFFAEAIFFPLPIDPLLIIACLKNQAKCFYYAALATFASVAGGAAAYCIGTFLWNEIGSKIIAHLSAPDNFNIICYQLEKYESWAVLIAGFTPFPYKVMALMSGFCSIPIKPFIIFSFVSRGARFILIAFLAKKYGTKVQHYIDRYGMILLIIFTLVCFMSYFLFGIKLG